jgi:mannose-6-phosphate isomerase-like protein (cupin superfamily)
VDDGVRGAVIRLAEIATAIPGPDGQRAANAVRRGTLDIALSLPVGPNVQTPHEQDELYVVIRGNGTLLWDGGCQHFETGDILFVAAGTEHHYADYSADLALWRIFYGEKGGEIPR